MRYSTRLFSEIISIIAHSGGYWLVEADSKEELVKWAQRCPADEGDVIEIRQIFDEADFAIKK